jgi:hypothetical protein
VDEGEVRELRDLPPEERRKSLVSLGRRVAGGESDETVVSILAQLAKDEGEVDTRHAWVSYVVASRSEEFIPVLEKWLASSGEELRLGIVGALAWIVTPRTNDILLNLVRSDGSSRVRRNALRHLVRRGSLGEWEPVDLLAIARESDWRPITKREYLKIIDVRRSRGDDPALED